MSVESEPTAGGVVAGLSIDDGSLRVVVIERGDQPTVVEAAEADLAPGTVRDGRVVDQPALARRIGALWHALNLGGVPTFLGLHPLDGEVQVVAVADWPRSGWPAEVRAVAAQRRRELDAEPVWNADRFDTDDGPLARIVSCRREDLSSAVWAARRSGVWLAGVELSALAVERVLLGGPPLSSLLVDGTGAGPVTVLLLQVGVAVRCWRAPRTAADADMLNLVPLDAVTAQALLQEPAHPWADLVAARVAVSAPARLVGPGAGLAATSPVPQPGFAAAFGLALAAAGVGAAPVDLQPALLHSGTERLQARMGSLSAAVVSSAPPAAAPSPPPAGMPLPAPSAQSEPPATVLPVEPLILVEPLMPVAPVVPADPPAPATEVVVPSPVVPDDRPIILQPRTAVPQRTLAVEAFLAGPGPLVVPNGSDDERGRELSAESERGPESTTARPVEIGAFHGADGATRSGGADVGSVAPLDTAPAGVAPAAPAQPEVESPEVESPEVEAPGTATAEDDGAALPHRGRRAAAVAVVAGAAAVGSFFVVRDVLPDSSGDREPPATTEAPAAVPNPGRP